MLHVWASIDALMLIHVCTATTIVAINMISGLPCKCHWHNAISRRLIGPRDANVCTHTHTSLRGKLSGS